MIHEKRYSNLYFSFVKGDLNGFVHNPIEFSQLDKSDQEEIIKKHQLSKNTIMDSANNIKKNNLLMCIEMSDNDQYKQNTVNLKNDYLNNMNPFLSNYKFEYKPQLLFDNLQNLLENNAQFSSMNSNVSINSESINHNNNSDLSKKTFNNFHSSNKSNNNKNIFHTKQETNYEQMENQIEELSRIKLEDIDDLNSLLTSADQSSIDKTVTKQETYSNIKQNSFVPNLFNNVCNFTKAKENYEMKSAEQRQVNINSNSAKAVDMKIDIENNSILDVDLDDELMISLLNDTKKSDLSQMMNFQMNSLNDLNENQLMINNDMKNSLKERNRMNSNIDFNNNQILSSNITLLTIDTENTSQRTYITMNFDSDNVEQQNLELDDFTDKEFFLDTDGPIENPSKIFLVIIISLDKQLYNVLYLKK